MTATIINALDRIANALEKILAKMDAAALPAVTAEDVGKVLTVSEEGAWVAELPASADPDDDVEQTEET